MEVLIGVDPHKATNVVAVLSEQGELLDHASFCTNTSALRALMRWAKRFPERCWALEGANAIGYLISRHLLASGEKVVDVPAKLSARIGVLSVGNERKNNQLDALYVALAACHSERLTEVNDEGYVSILRMLSERREDLVQERTTRTLNRLHRLLRDLLPGGASTKLSAPKRRREHCAGGCGQDPLQSELDGNWLQSRYAISAPPGPAKACLMGGRACVISWSEKVTAIRGNTVLRRGEITNGAWQQIEPLLSEYGQSGGQWREHRTIINGFLWKLRTGSPWRDLPERYGPWQTCYDRFVRWRRDGTWDRLLARAQTKNDALGEVQSGR